jgi:hypothetical protein
MLHKSPEARPAALDLLRRRIERIAVVDEAREAPAAAPLTASRVDRPRYLAETAAGRGAGGALALGLDTRLGRPVIIETLDASYLRDEAGQRHLAWLRALARLGGPRLQRLFTLIARPDGGTDAIFEASGPSRPAAPHAHERLRRSLARVHGAGVAHGSIASSIVHEAHGPVLLVAGRAPRPSASVDGDLAALAGC